MGRSRYQIHPYLVDFLHQWFPRTFLMHICGFCWARRAFLQPISILHRKSCFRSTTSLNMLVVPNSTRSTCASSNRRLIIHVSRIFVDVPCVCCAFACRSLFCELTSLTHFFLVNMYFTFKNCASLVLISIQYSVYIHFVFP
jgi:hypothetical protein